MKLSIWWKDLILKISLLFVTYKVIASFYAIYKAFRTIDKNPLIPDVLYKYVAFPYYFLTPIWIILFVVLLQLIIKEHLILKWFWVVMIGVVVFEFSEFYLYYLLCLVSPYA